MEIDELVPSWERSLRAANKSPKTIEDYARAARRYARWAAGGGLPREVEGIERDHLRDYFAELVETRAPATALANYKFLQQFFRWLVDEDEVERSPMERLKPPHVPDALVPVLDDNDLALLLKACDGRGFEDRRDAAIVRVFLDTGVRLGGLLSMTVAGVDLDGQVATVLLKGRKEHTVPFGARTADAIDRYMRLRRRHDHYHLDALWLGQRGAFGKSGVERMLGARAREAGIEHVHPHRFRHTNAHTWLANGGSETDLMRLMGWSSRQMLSRYGRSAADARAREAHRRMALGDRL